MEEARGKRISGVRLDQARETGAGTVAAGCPFCITMFEDGIKTKGWDGAMQVKDVSELIVAALPKDTADEMINIREDELLVTMPQRPAARLTQRRYYDDPEVRRRAPARGQYWVPPLGPERPDGPLTPPPPLELPPPTPIESQAAQPEYDHAADGTGDVADTAGTSTDGATRGTVLVAVGVPTSLEDEADPFGSDVEH